MTARVYSGDRVIIDSVTYVVRCVEWTIHTDKAKQR